MTTGRRLNDRSVGGRDERSRRGCPARSAGIRSSGHNSTVLRSSDQLVRSAQGAGVTRFWWSGGFIAAVGHPAGGRRA